MATNSPEGEGRCDAPGATLAFGGGERRPVDVRCDAFYGGRFHLLQPVSAGFRSGLDALLLAATLDPRTTGRVADLGAGSGAVGLAAAVRCPGVEAVLVENSPQMAALARQSVALPENLEVSARIDVLETDLLATRGDREIAGLRDGAFDCVLTNPPYNDRRGRRPADPLRGRALVAAGATGLERWMRVAGALLRHGGRFSTIVRADAVGGVLPVIERYVGGASLHPVHPRPAEPALRAIITARKGSRAPLRVHPSRFLFDADGRESGFSRAVARGDAILSIDS